MRDEYLHRVRLDSVLFRVSTKGLNTAQRERMITLLTDVEGLWYCYEVDRDTIVVGGSSKTFSELHWQSCIADLLYSVENEENDLIFRENWIED